jgi:hypothetical protein
MLKMSISFTVTLYMSTQLSIFQQNNLHLAFTFVSKAILDVVTGKTISVLT